jgi:hypothetical protein
MKRLSRLIFTLVALSILNQSIDFDYLTFGFGSNQREATYDDVDTIVEYIVEAITGDDHYTSDNNDDSGMAQHKAPEKHTTIPLYVEAFKKIKVVSGQEFATAWFAGLDQSNKICKGYFSVSAPPPKA